MKHMQTSILQKKETPGNATVYYEGPIELNDRSNNETLRVLSEEDWKFWKENGYVIIHDAVPREQVDRLADLLWEFEEKDPNNMETWYEPARREIRMVELKNSGMVEMYNHQYQWDNRQYPKVYDAFVDIWGREDLWVTIDRANLNVPERPGHEFKGFIHWDIDTSINPKPVNVQGTLSLTETSPETGGFQCIPELFRNFNSWVKTQSEDRDPFQPDISGFEIVQVTTKPGDLLIWDSMLAHGIRPNHSSSVRMAQYISMSPAQYENSELRKWRIQSWEKRIAPEGYPFPGDPRNWEQNNAEKAELSEMGRKLLGLDSW